MSLHESPEAFEVASEKRDIEGPDLFSPEQMLKISDQELLKNIEENFPDSKGFITNLLEHINETKKEINVHAAPSPESSLELIKQKEDLTLVSLKLKRLLSGNLKIEVKPKAEEPKIVEGPSTLLKSFDELTAEEIKKRKHELKLSIGKARAAGKDSEAIAMLNSISKLTAQEVALKQQAQEGAKIISISSDSYISPDKYKSIVKGAFAKPLGKVIDFDESKIDESIEVTAARIARDRGLPILEKDEEIKKQSLFSRARARVSSFFRRS